MIDRRAPLRASDECSPLHGERLQLVRSDVQRFVLRQLLQNEVDRDAYAGCDERAMRILERQRASPRVMVTSQHDRETAFAQVPPRVVHSRLCDPEPAHGGIDGGLRIGNDQGCGFRHPLFDVAGAGFEAPARGNVRRRKRTASRRCFGRSRGVRGIPWRAR